MGVGIAEEGDEETARGGVGLAEGPTGVTSQYREMQEERRRGPMSARAKLRPLG